MSDLQDIGASLGFAPLSDDQGRLSARLDGLISGSSLLTIDDAVARQMDDVYFAVAHINYRRKSDHNNYKTFRETVVLLEVPGVTFPHLAIQPRTFGSWLMEKAAGLTGLQELDFAGHETYDKIYSTFTFMPDPARRLMDDELLTYLTERNGLKVQTSDDRVLVGRPGKRLAGDELTALIDDAQGVLSRLTASARRLREGGWDPKQAATDMPQNMGGLLGMMLRGRMVTREQAEEFIAQSPPRSIPGNISKSFVSTSSSLRNVAFVASGLLCLAVAVLTYLAIDGLLPSMPGIPIIAMLALFLIGAVTGSVFANRFHRGRMRLLRMGEVTAARILQVTETNMSVNEQRRFKVTLEYEVGGQTRQQTVNAYGQCVQLAQSLLQSGESTQVLYNSEAPDSVLWPGTLVNWTS